MINEKMEILNRLVEILNQNGATILGYYSEWYIVSSFLWVVVGVLVIISGYRLNYELDDYSELPPASFVKWWFVAAGVLMLLCNLPDLISHEASAIHRLIVDIKS